MSDGVIGQSVSAVIGLAGSCGSGVIDDRAIEHRADGALSHDMIRRLLRSQAGPTELSLQQELVELHDKGAVPAGLALWC